MISQIYWIVSYACHSLLVRECMKIIGGRGGAGGGAGDLGFISSVTKTREGNSCKFV